MKTDHSGSWGTDRTEYYGYDSNLDYLINVDYNDGYSNEYQEWTYDDAGNRASDSTFGGGGTWTYDNLNRMTAGAAHTYTNDILGNRTYRDYQQVGSWKYTWDELNRAKTISGPTTGAVYHYRADGMRFEKVEGMTTVWTPPGSGIGASGHYDDYHEENQPTTRYYYDGQMPCEEDYTTGTEQDPDVVATRYGIGARGIDYIDKIHNESWVGCQFPIYDGHGNMIATIARNNDSPYYTVANQREYDVWGKIRAQSSVDSPNGPKMRYCANLGHPTDDESGLIYMRARYMEPWTGRFISEDPDRFGPNWFTYCSSSPISKFDSSGKMEEYDWISTLFRGDGEFMDGLRAAYENGGLEEFLQYINDHFKVAEMNFGVGGAAIAGRGMFLRIWMHMATIEEWLADGSMWIGEELGGLQYLAIDSSDVAGLVAAGESADVLDL